MEVKNIYKILILLLSFSLLISNAYSQEDEEVTEETTYEPILKFSYLKNTEGNRILKCTILTRLEGKWTPIENAELTFSVSGDSIIELGTQKSDNLGVAVLEVDKSINIPTDENGATTYTVEYKGVENSEPNSEELTIVDVNLEMSLEEIDSVKTIIVKASKKGAEGEIVPVEDQDVNIYVKRLYSNLKVGQAYLEEGTGEGSLEYKLIPGDSLGNIIIIARIDEHEEFGNVEVRQTINWGTPVSYAIKDIKREIWTDEAPLWMTITVIIFVLGVWYHLILVFIRMWKIKKLEKNTIN